MARPNIRQGDKVIATARPRGSSNGTDRLAALKSAGAAVLELDVTATQETLDAKAKQAWEIYGRVDVLVNNAGYIDAGTVEEIRLVLCFPLPTSILFIISDKMLISAYCIPK